MNIVAYSWPSRIGTFVIRLNAQGRWDIWFQDDMLGSYHSAVSALDDLVGGHCDWPGTTDPSTLGLPDELGDWTAHVGRPR